MKTTLAFGTTLSAMAVASLLAIFNGLDLPPRIGAPATVVGQTGAVAAPAAVPAAPLAATAQGPRDVRLDTVVITGRAQRSARSHPAEAAPVPTASRPFMSRPVAD